MSAATWNELHTDSRHQLRYPSEDVVRWLAGLNLARPSTERYFGNALDIGCGAGRHLRLLSECGFKTTGVDMVVAESVEADIISRGEMTDLPFVDDWFDIALAYGVFYYGTMGEADQAVQEMHRVMRPGGHGFVCVRSCRDWRMDHLDRDGVFRLDGEPEDGMLLDFINRDEVEEIYGSLFSSMSYEIAETTTHGLDRLNSDWLVTVQK